MKHIARPNPTQPAVEQTLAPSDVPEFDVAVMLDKVGVVLQREISNLLRASAAGKLDRAQSQDLVAYARLLADMKQEQTDRIANMTDEQLEKAAQKE